MAKPNKYWRPCARCESDNGCRECLGGEIPRCPSCSNSPDVEHMSMSDADAWVDDVMAHGDRCPSCVAEDAKIEAEKAPTDPAPASFGSTLTETRDPFEAS